MATFVGDERVVTSSTHGVWTTCDDCDQDWWCVGVDRDELDEITRWICSDGCDDVYADDDFDGAPCCPDPGCNSNPCTFPGYAANH